MVPDGPRVSVSPLLPSLSCAIEFYIHIPDSTNQNGRPGAERRCSPVIRMTQPKGDLFDFAVLHQCLGLLQVNGAV